MQLPKTFTEPSNELAHQIRAVICEFRAKTDMEEEDAVFAVNRAIRINNYKAFNEWKCIAGNPSAAKIFQVDGNISLATGVDRPKLQEYECPISE